MLSTTKSQQRLKGEVRFLHIKSYNKDSSNHISHKYYYDEECSSDGWSSLPTSPLAENSGGLGALKVLQKSIEKNHNASFKRNRMLLVSSRVPTLKHKVTQQLITRKQLCFLQQLKEPSQGYRLLFSFVFQCRNMRGPHETFSEFLVLKKHTLYFTADCHST